MWSTAATVLVQLAAAVETYARELQQAQDGAAQAISYQNQAEAATWTAVAYYYHARAELTLRTAQIQLYFASTTLAAAFDQARATLPTLAPAPTTLQAAPPQYAPAPAATTCGPDWVDPAAPWQLPGGSRYPYLPGQAWPAGLASPNALSDLLFTRLGRSPYQQGVLTSLAEKPGWGLESFRFAGLNGEVEAGHKGVWAFGGAFDGAGIKGVGTGDSALYLTAGGIAGTGAVVGRTLYKSPVVEVETATEAGLLWEAGGTLSRKGPEGFGSMDNPALYGSQVVMVHKVGLSVGGEIGALVHNEPGESCTYTVFAGVQPPRLGVAGEIGPVKGSLGVWAGRGLSITTPSAATTPWQCVEYLPESLRNTLPWWAPETHK